MKLEGRPKDQIQQLAKMLPVGKDVQVSFSKHSAPAKLLEVKLARLADLPNKSEKRPGEGGKEKSPTYVTLVFDSFIFDIVLEDFEIYQLVGGIKFIGTEVEVTVEEIRHGNSGTNQSIGSAETS